MAVTDTDFIPGDPAAHVIGKPEEKPAKRHAKQKPKPIKTARGIAADIEHRMQILEPVIAEYKVLEELHAILKPSKE